MKSVSSVYPTRSKFVVTAAVLSVLLTAAFSAMVLCDSEDSSAASAGYAAVLDTGVGIGVPDPAGADAEKEWTPAVWALLLSVFLLPVVWFFDLRYRPPVVTSRHPPATDAEIRAYQTGRYAEIAEMQAREDVLSRRVRALSDRRRLGISGPGEDGELAAARGELASLRSSIRSAKGVCARESRRMYGLKTPLVPLVFYEVRVLAPTLKL